MKSKFYFLPSFIWGILILIACGLPSYDVEKVSVINFPEIDKVAHFTFHFGLISLILWGKSKLNLLNSFKSYLLPALLVFFYGVIIEILQYLIFIGRSASVFDEMANTAGLVCGILFFVYVYNRYIKKIPATK
jgi:VanZ family protein